MEYAQVSSYSAFEGTRRIAAGELPSVALAAKAVIERGAQGPVLIFDDATGRQVEVDMRGADAEVLNRLAVTPETPEAPSGPGRPRLGVVAREVTLLPRHWDWLNSQPGGASVTLRKLVEQAKRSSESGDRIRRAQETAYRVMTALAGNAPGYEEATRALFAQNREAFETHTAAWPPDVRDYARQLAHDAFDPNGRDAQ